MSDGDNATPGHAAPDHLRASRKPRPPNDAAPAELRSTSRPDDEPAGSHARRGGVTVAELIAKMGTEAARPPSHRAYPDPDPPDDSPARQPAHRAVPDLVFDPVPDDVTARTPAVYAPQIPDPSATADEASWETGETARLPITDETTQLPVIDETTEYETNDYETTDYETTDYETTDYETTDYETTDYETTDYDYGEPDHETTKLPVTADPEPKAPRRPMVMAGRLVALLMAMLALVLTGGTWQWSNAKNHSFNTVAALDPNSRDIIDADAHHGDKNFLIAGINDHGGASDQTAGARSDAVMLVNIPASRKRAVVVSFPRNLAITPMQCNSWNNDTGKYGSNLVSTGTKLKSAYASGGPKCLVNVIQKISGLSINRFMAIDFAGFAKMVDALGGVEVCSPTPLQDNDLGTVLDHAGPQIVDGRTALNYVLARKVTTDSNGDDGHIERQQLFVSSLLRSMVSPEVLFDPVKLNNFVNAFISNSYVDNVNTKDLVDLGRSLQNFAAGPVTFATVPTGTAGADGNEPLRTGDTRTIFDAIRNDDPLPPASDNPTAARLTQQASTSSPAPTDNGEMVNAVTIEPKDVTVHVSNSTGQNGLAATTAGELRQRGFNVLNPDNYGSFLPATTVYFSPGNEPAAATVASSLPNPQIERVTGMGDVVQVVLGPDFSVVNAPQPSGSAVKMHVNHGAPTTSTQPAQNPNAATTCGEPVGG